MLEDISRCEWHDYAGCLQDAGQGLALASYFLYAVNIIGIYVTK
jgi:hypothetical protein